MLGTVVVRAWKGEYECVADVLTDVRAVLETYGRNLLLGHDDEIDGISWTNRLEVVRDHRGANVELRVRPKS